MGRLLFCIESDRFKGQTDGRNVLGDTLGKTICYLTCSLDTSNVP